MVVVSIFDYINLSFRTALSPLFVKVWRMHGLLTASKGFQRVNVNHCAAVVYSLPIIVLESIVLMTFSFVDPPRATEILTLGSGFGEQAVLCAQQTNSFFITQFIFHGKYS
jgi:hypothetical protein